MCLTGVHYHLPACSFPHLHTPPDTPYIVSNRFPLSVPNQFTVSQNDLGYEVKGPLIPPVRIAPSIYGQSYKPAYFIVRLATPCVYTPHPRDTDFESVRITETAS